MQFFAPSRGSGRVRTRRRFRCSPDSGCVVKVIAEERPERRALWSKTPGGYLFLPRVREIHSTPCVSQKRGGPVGVGIPPFNEGGRIDVRDNAYDSSATASLARRG